MSLKTLVAQATPIMEVTAEFEYAYVWFDGFGDGAAVTDNLMKVISVGPSTMEIGWTELVVEDAITGDLRFFNKPNETLVTWHAWCEDMDDED